MTPIEVGGSDTIYLKYISETDVLLNGTTAHAQSFKGERTSRLVKLSSL